MPKLRWKNATYASEDEAAEDDDGNDQPVDLGGKKKNVKKKPQAKKGGKSKAKAKPAGKKKTVNAEEAENLDEYQPGKYNQLRNKFIADEMAIDPGLSYRDASLLWNESEIRQRLLSNMSRSELKRRRFI